LYQRALKKSEAGDHVAAAALMIDAYTAAPQNAALANIGEEYRLGSRLEDAVKYYCLYLDKEPNGEFASQATEQVILAQRKLGHNIETDSPCVVKKPTEVTTKTTPEPVDLPPRDDGGEISKPVETPSVSDGSGLRIGGIAAGLLGVGGLGAGVYFTTRVQQAEKDHSDPSKAAQADIDGKAAERNSQIAYIAGGALVVTGIVLYVVGAGKRKNTVAVAPMVTSSSAGLAFGGSF
jgi:hypothetical protein